MEVIHGDGLPGVGFIHSLTFEEAFMRPHDFVEEVATEGGDDPLHGLEGCDMEDVLDRIAAVVAGDKETGIEGRTPLLIDTSPDRKMVSSGARAPQTS